MPADPVHQLRESDVCRSRNAALEVAMESKMQVMIGSSDLAI